MSILDTLRKLEKGAVVKVEHYEQTRLTSKLHTVYGEFENLEKFTDKDIILVGRTGIYVADIQRLTVYSVEMVSEDK